MTPPRLLLVDDAEESGRSTVHLLGSLSGRLGVLHAITGAQAVGSIIAGIAELGREVSRSAEGARVRRAVETGRAKTNGEALWRALRIGDWASMHSPTPVLDQLRNDVALLLADDLEQTLELLPVPPQMAGARGAEEPPEAEFVDFLVGYWALATETGRAIAAILAPTLPPPGEVGVAATPEPDTPLLR